jgi:hypothetical protein
LTGVTRPDAEPSNAATSKRDKGRVSNASVRPAYVICSLLGAGTRRAESLPNAVINGIHGPTSRAASAVNGGKLTQPATAPADPTLDWLLNQATTAPSAPAPATVPSTQEETPFGENKNPDIRRGAITLSDGEKIPGKLATTAEQPIRLWDEQKKEYRDIPWKVIKSMQAKVLWEREEPEWHFKESGSDIKEFSGKTYPNREMQYTIELRNGQSVTGGVAAPIYLQTPKGNKLFILHKRDKGEVGQTLKDLVYVKRVDLEEDEDGKK